VVGVALGLFFRSRIEDRELRAANFHPQFVADTIIRQYVFAQDVASSLSPPRRGSLTTSSAART
jgi:hypothetical protein